MVNAFDSCMRHTRVMDHFRESEKFAEGKLAFDSAFFQSHTRGRLKATRKPQTVSTAGDHRDNIDVEKEKRTTAGIVKRQNIDLSKIETPYRFVYVKSRSIT